MTAPGQPTAIAWLQSSRDVIAVLNDTLYILNSELPRPTTGTPPIHPPQSITVHDVESIPHPHFNGLLGFVLVLGTVKDEAVDSHGIRRPRTASAE
ncbi:hypothetical protein FRC01_006926, partial [Tulasnella sp. 417]